MTQYNLGKVTGRGITKVGYQNNYLTFTFSDGGVASFHIGTINNFIEDNENVFYVDELPTTDIMEDALYVYNNEIYMYSNGDWVNIISNSSSVESILGDLQVLSTNLSNLHDNLTGFNEILITFDEDNDNLDTDLTKLKDNLQRFTSKVQDLIGEFSELSEGFDDFTSQTNQFTSDIDALNSDIDSLQSETSQFSTDITNFNNSIGTLQSEMEELSQESTSLGTQLGAMDTRLNGVDSSLSSFQTTLTGLNTSLTNLDQRLENLRNGLYDSEGNLITTNEDTLILSNQLSNIVGDFNVLAGYLLSFEGNLTNLKNELTSQGIELNYFDIDDDILKLFASIGTVKESISIINNETIPKVHEDISNFQSDLYGENTTVFKLTDEYAEYSIDVSENTLESASLKFMVYPNNTVYLKNIGDDTGSIILNGDFSDGFDNWNKSDENMTIMTENEDNYITLVSESLTGADNRPQYLLQDNLNLTNIETITFTAKSLINDSISTIVVFVGDESASYRGLYDDVDSIINEELPTVQDGITSAQEDITGIQEDIGDSSTQGTVRYEISQSKSQINTINNTTIPSMTGAINTAQSTANTAQSTANTLKNTTIPAVSATANSAQTTANTLKNTTIPNLQAEVNTAKGVCDDIVEMTYKGEDGSGTVESPAENTVLYDVNSAKSSIEAVQSDIGQAQESMTSVNQSISAINTQLYGTGTNQTTANGNSIWAKLSTLLTNIGSSGDAVTGTSLWSKVKKAISDSETVSNDLTSLSNRIGDDNDTLTDNTLWGKLNNTDTNLNGLANMVGTSEDNPNTSNSLWAKTKKANTDVSALSAMIGSSSDNPDTQNTIWAKVKKASTEASSSLSTLTGITNSISNITGQLYGTGTSSDNATDGSIWYRIKDVLARLTLAEDTIVDLTDKANIKVVIKDNKGGKIYTDMSSLQFSAKVYYNDVEVKDDIYTEVLSNLSITIPSSDSIITSSTFTITSSSEIVSSAVLNFPKSYLATAGNYTITNQYFTYTFYVEKNTFMNVDDMAIEAQERLVGVDGTYAEPTSDSICGRLDLVSNSDNTGRLDAIDKQGGALDVLEGRIGQSTDTTGTSAWARINSITNTGGTGTLDTLNTIVGNKNNVYDANSDSNSLWAITKYAKSQVENIISSVGDDTDTYNQNSQNNSLWALYHKLNTDITGLSSGVHNAETALYGTGNSSSNATSGSIFYRIKQIYNSDNNTGALVDLESNIGNVKRTGAGNLQNQIATLLELSRMVLNCVIVDTVEEMNNLNLYYGTYVYVRQTGKFYEFNMRVAYFDANNNEVTPTGGEDILLSPDEEEELIDNAKGQYMLGESMLY